MLVLSRKPGERISIGNNVEIVVLKVMGSRVRLGISAPNGLAVWREEIGKKADEEAAAPIDSPAQAGGMQAELCANV